MLFLYVFKISRPPLSCVFSALLQASVRSSLSSQSAPWAVRLIYGGIFIHYRAVPRGVLLRNHISLCLPPQHLYLISCSRLWTSLQNNKTKYLSRFIAHSPTLHHHHTPWQINLATRSWQIPLPMCSRRTRMTSRSPRPTFPSPSKRV